MRLLIRLLLWLVGLIVTVAGGGLAYLFAKYPDVPPAEQTTVKATPEKLARGEYLSKHVTGCVVCHAQIDTTRFAEPVIEATRGAGGQNFGDAATALRVLYSKNITPSAIGTWTDGELIRAFTAGVSKNGEALFPVMPYLRYGKLSREDVEAIVAYVRTLKPVEYMPPAREPRAAAADRRAHDSRGRIVPPDSREDRSRRLRRVHDQRRRLRRLSHTRRRPRATAARPRLRRRLRVQAAGWWRRSQRQHHRGREHGHRHVDRGAVHR